METSVPQATLVLACGDQVVARAGFTSERSQEVDLFAPLEQVLNQLPEGERLSAVVVGTGPGSYNGARVGIASAQAIAQVHGCRVAGLCSFEGVRELSSGGWAVGDARRGSFFYLQVIEGEVSGKPELVEGEVFLKWLADREECLATFENVSRLNLSEDLAGQICEATSEAEVLLERWLGRSEEERQQLLDGEVEAFYLRAPHITKAKK